MLKPEDKVEKPIAVEAPKVEVSTPTPTPAPKPEPVVEQKKPQAPKKVVKKGPKPIPKIKKPLVVEQKPEPVIAIQPAPTVTQPAPVVATTPTKQAYQEPVTSKKIAKEPQPFIKTEGSYVGFDLMALRTTFLVHDVVYGTPASYPPSNQGMNYGFGLNYKYAFNFNRFFVAPGIFLEKNLTGKTKGRNGVNLRNNARYGVKADFGYDLTNAFSPYFSVGYAQIDYRSRARGDGLIELPSGDYNNLTIARNGHDRNWFYGVGFKVSLTKSLSLNLEYNSQNFLAKALVPADSKDYLSNAAFTGKSESLKLGLSHNF